MLYLVVVVGMVIYSLALYHNDSHCTLSGNISRVVVCGDRIWRIHRIATNPAVSL